MITSEKILQCEKCNRYFNGDLSLRSEKVLMCVPEIFRCPEADCDEVAARNENREKLRQDARRNRIRGVSCGVQSSKFKVQSHLSPQNFRSSCPPEIERDYYFETAPENARAHAENQSAFVADGSGDTNCERMLELLCKNFNPLDPARKSRGRWIGNKELTFTHKLLNAHSRASQLRGSETLTPHPFVKKYRLDIDTKVIAGDWHYSVCFVERSERLARERDKVEKNQNTF